MTVPLEDLLSPHLDRRLAALAGTGRFVDTPPDLVREVLALLDPEWSRMRANFQPPAAWLVDQADRYGGLLGGSYSTDPFVGFRVDAICVPRASAQALATDVLDTWPPQNEWGAAIDLALAEGWTAWDAVQSAWEGPGRALLDDLPDLPVFGLWWD